MAKKKGKKAKSKSSSKDSTVPPDKVDLFLLCIKIESCKLSLQKYKQEYIDSKEQLKEHRTQFQKLILTELTEVKRSLGKIDQFGLKEIEMTAAEATFQVEKDVQSAALVKSYQQTIEGLQSKIASLEAQIDKRSNDLLEYIEFSQVPDSFLEAEINQWRLKFDENIELHQKGIAKLSRRHENSVRMTHLRCEDFIAAAEVIACQRETAKMTEIEIRDFTKNQKLHEQLNLIKTDQIRLIEEIHELEQKHMRLVKCNIQVDWDMRYLNIDDEKPLLNDADIFTKKTDLTQKYKHLAAIGQTENIAKEILSLELDCIDKKNELGIFGQHVTMNDPNERGPVKYHGIKPI